jgi:putative pyruvate formate lyase activating enzyme
MSNARTAIDRLRGRIADCSLCPRTCRVDRTAGQVGACRIGATAKVAHYGAHFGEEQALVGQGGSGTIFLAGCNLECVYCHNCDISQSADGQECDAGALADIALELQGRGCENVNFVTPSHVAHAVAEAVVLARDKGLRVPVVYNSAGYDSVETLKDLQGLVDVYLPDFKYASAAASARYSQVDDYPQVARAALAEMARQVGKLECNDRGVATRGLLVRHLVLPQGVDDSENVLNILAQTVPGVAVHVMGQYRPSFKAGQYERLRQRVQHYRIRSLETLARQLGLTLVAR